MIPSNSFDRRITYRDNFGGSTNSALGGNREVVRIADNGLVCDLYSCGATDNGQLGHGETHETHHKVPLQVATDVKISQLGCGAGHCIALTNNRKVFTWGLNVYGQLGHGDTVSRWKPTLIESLNQTSIKFVTAGAGHCLAICSSGLPYCWGANADFQSGISSKTEINTNEVLRPSPIEYFQEHKIMVKSGSCGVKHSALLTSKQALICFGSNEFGQCADENMGALVCKTNFSSIRLGDS